MSSPFGHALIDLWGGGVLSSYDAKGWYAQLSELTDPKKGGPRGYLALTQAGLDVTQRTLIKWLSDRDYPIRSGYQKQIQRAYDIRRGATWSPRNETHLYQISGTVKLGNDVRDRGSDGTAPLRIDGRAGDWKRIRESYENGSLTEDEAEEWFIEDVIVPDIGEGTDPWEFTGSAYMVI